jgi:hypothetical protein
MGILLLLGCLYLIYKLVEKIKSRGKKPLKKRTWHFFFSWANFLLFGLGGILLYPMMLLVSVGSNLRMILLLILICVGVVSLISLFKPKFTKVIFALYGLVAIVLYFESPNTNKLTTYHDICNELRMDKNCSESESGFECHPPSKHGHLKKSKDLCENKTGKNDESKIEMIPHPYIGKVVKTDERLLYIKNLPRNNCRNRACGYVVDTRIEEVRNRCGGCLRADRVTTLLRMVDIPIGTELRVIGAFKTSDIFFGSSSGHEFLILQDSTGVKSEISDIGFRLMFLKNQQNGYISPEEKLAEEKWNEFKAAGELRKTVCLYDDFRHTRKSEKNLTRFPEYSKHVEVRFLNFIESFQLQKEFTIIDTSWLILPNAQDSSNPNKKIALSCATIEIKSEAAYLLSTYYASDWGLHVSGFNQEQMNADCLPYELKDEYAGYCAKIEEVHPFTVKTSKEFIKYKRPNQDEFLSRVAN